MVIKSNTKKFSGTRSSFEQRATNSDEQKIFYFNQPVVKFPISEENKPVLKYIIAKMRTSMRNCGIGLAHNQYPKKKDSDNPYAIFVIELQKKGLQDYEAPFEGFVNPVIVGYSKQKVGFYHACLSAIGTGKAKVSTYKEILIAFFSDNLELQIKKYTGMAAIICQHEFNHLATCGTYVDSVNSYINGNRFKHAGEFYLSDEEILKKSIDPSRILETVEEDLPCLIDQEVLARCKTALDNDSLYKNYVDKFLENYPEDKLLYDNLMALDLSLYKKSELKLYDKIQKNIG